MRFSERRGYKTPAPMLQEHDLPEELRNCIWNLLWILYFNDKSVGGFDGYNDSFHVLSMRLRNSYFKITIDDRPSNPKVERKYIRDRYFAFRFPEFYDFLEFMANDDVESANREHGGGRRSRRDTFVKRCNQVLEQEKSRFRFVSNLITTITNDEEMEAVEMAAVTDEAGVHIRRAIELYRDRTNPDYRNSVKESISAVEATYRRMTGTIHKNFGVAIAAMEKEGMDLPEPLKTGFSKIYGWTSGKGGIRHALTKGARPVSEAEARLMLVMCSAYVNYLLSLRSNGKLR